MYESYFQFQSAPFPATPIVSNYFPAESVETSRETLVRLIERAEGPGLIIGQAGVGKSLLLQLLNEHFAARFRVVFLSGARIATRKAFIQHILFELGLPFRGMDEGELRLALIDTLRPTESSPSGILLLIDEAHTLPLRLLEETRMITNVVRDGQPRVRLVLAGNARLEERFASPKLESFNQRIAARCYLHPFTRDETHEYIRAELSWAGGDPDALFSEEAIRAVFTVTDGIPRLVNQVCDHALIMAQSASVRRVDAGMVQAAWSDLQQLPIAWNASSPDPQTPRSTVIEFGQLDDVESTMDASSEFPADESTEVSDLEGTWQVPVDAASTRSNLEFSIDDLEYHVESLLVGQPTSDGPAEWIECGSVAREDTPSSPAIQPSTEVPVSARTTDPFGSGFDEEIVVVDRDAVNEIEAFRGRPRVTCPESYQFADELRNHLQSKHSATLAAASDSTSSPDAAQTGTVFEFNTMHTANSESDLDEDFSSPDNVQSGVPDVSSWEPDDDVHCVPLPWTRGTLGDDRDLIIVEDDSPDSYGAGSNQVVSGTRQVEYHELFSQLRRTTHP